MFPTVNKMHLFLLILIKINTADFITGPDQCKSTVTMVNGLPANCSDEIIFEDDFSGEFLDTSKWSIEHRIPKDPDYEFNMYLNNVDNVLQINNGTLMIKPTATSKHFYGDILRRTFSLGPSCTGRLETDECVFHPRTANKINPLITAQIKTKDKFSFKYGRVEIRAQMPAVMWVYPQLWLEPNKAAYGDKQYYSGQMRVAHTIANGDDITLSGGLILNAQEPWRSLKMCQHLNNSINLAKEFHLYELIWHLNYIALSVDGQQYCHIEIENDEGAFKNLEISGKQLPNCKLLNKGNNWAPFDGEFFLTLGYGVGGHKDFEDNGDWVEKKPWKNNRSCAKKSFWNKYSNRLSWLNESELIIDYVKVFAI